MDGVQRTDLKRMKMSDPKVYVHKDGKTMEISADKKDEYMAKGWKLSSMRAEGVMNSYGDYLEMEFKRQNKYKDIGDFEASPEFQALIQKHPVFKDKGQTEDHNSSRGMNKYGLAARNKDGKFYSYQNGKLTGTFDNMKDLQKHQQQIVQQMDDKHNQESTNEDLAQMAQKVEQDHEVQMARSDLYKAAKYSIKLHDILKNVSEEQGLEGWVAAKITKAADYLSSVKHYMEYEMMPQDNVELPVEPTTEPVEDAVDYKESLANKLQNKLKESTKTCKDCNKPTWETLDEAEKQKGVDGKVCWKGYKRMGTKMKGGKRVDNCVPIKKK